MIKYEEVISNNLIEAEILSNIPSKCRCGAKIEFSESLKEITCSNHNCVYRVAYRLHSMMKSLGVDGFTESVCNILCRDYNFTTPFQVMLIKQISDNVKNISIVDFNKRVKDIEELKNRPLHLWNIIQCANIRYISELAEKLFSNYDSIEKAYEDLDRGQIHFISEKLGVSYEEPSIISILIYNELIKYREELIFAESQFNIIKYEKNPIRIAISGGINGYLNKSDYIQTLNNRYNGKVQFVLDSVITEDTKALVVDNDMTSAKCRTAKRINEKYISSLIADNELDLDDINKPRKGKELTLMGEKIAVCSGEKFIERLDRIYE